MYGQPVEVLHDAPPGIAGLIPRLGADVQGQLVRRHFSKGDDHPRRVLRQPEALLDERHAPLEPGGFTAVGLRKL
eukprot:4840093-Pyramimonas_sp.AAC.1